MSAKSRWLRDCAISIAVALLVVGVYLVVTRPPAPPPAESALARTVPEIDLRGVTFEEAVERMSAAWEVPIEVEWDSLRDWGLTRSYTVDLWLREVTLHDALMHLFQYYNAFDFFADEDRIVIDTGEHIFGQRVLRLYYVGDVVREAEKWGEINYYSFGDQVRASSPDAAVLPEVVRSIVLPDGWRDTGGPYSLYWMGDWLLIDQTPKLHQKIENLLDVLRQETLNDTGRANP